MPDLQMDTSLLEAFEQGLDPAHPERSAIPARILGYGEISTVLELQTGGEPSPACKRLPMFRSPDEVTAYERLYRRYVDTLQNGAGVRLVPDTLVRVTGRRGQTILYILQQKLPPHSIAHKAIHRLPPAAVERLVDAVLQETRKVFDFNRRHRGELELGFDGQISNWAILGLEEGDTRLPEPLSLAYLDTSTPLLRQNGQEQLDPELFLRSAPSFLVWIIRLLFLEEVMTRYYDFRQVAVDLIANFYKEQRPDLVPALVEQVNRFFAAHEEYAAFNPLTVSEIQAYYREDAWIWRIYLAFRKVDRTLHRLLRREYPYILPDKIQR
ncbi:MAG: hypothetical protein D6796_15085 [Caldilineae bacterium]|nr:MAG: hypothetical protein D6796_15085 [Caldilineae bacterium]